ncbi:Receptor-type guanylate cyclase gcy [Seminavis robusta]|uniref:Receptor-type guanylate cyclase gcy n=1 Tax=Seminavis robusta TaxID=568900 RepID=A0A9N8E7I8_9STRA|nr:Receptor-type guanylate cyclase gcy [Seminavis robusta]|eukprot:Sro735_g194930.1 Receptor-type guanylate cyclase gcy (783) ;mRNA; r:35870-38770
MDVENHDYSSHRSDTAAAAGAEQKRLQENAAQTLAAKENRAVLMLRILVMTLLAVATAVVLAGVYTFSSQAEEKGFEDGFAIHAAQLTNTFGSIIESKLVAIGTFSNAITSYAMATESEFPFVTLPDFAVRGSDVRLLADAINLIWCPLVTDDNRLAWEEYAFSNRYQRNQATEQDNLMRQEQDEYFQQLVGQDESDDNSTRNLEEEEEDNPNILKDGSGYHLRIYEPRGETPEPNGTGPYLPEWQRSPLSNQVQNHINFNWVTGLYKDFDIVNRLMANPKVLINKMRVVSPKHRASFTGSLRAGHYRNKVNAYLDGPITFLAYPVLDSFNTTTRKLGGVILTNLYWQVYFQNVLPTNAQGILCVLSNSFNQTFSYLINGHNTTALGPEDFHDPRYDHMAVTLDVTSDVHRNSNPEKMGYLTVPLDDTVGRYILKVYPTDETRDEYITNNPIIYTVAVGVIFVITALVFVLFDTCVEKRQKVVMKRAAESGAIVDGLFPEQIQERIFEDEPKSENDNNKNTWGLWRKSMVDLKNESLEAGKQQTSLGRQIADEYKSCTVVFCDLPGFTAWSSTRSPKDVFQLLETVYSEMDAIALRRKVFKVETIGDCWLGVCGLPNPNPKHAVATARFADDCMKKVHELVVSLSDRLGADTGSIQIRTGLHSGSVTAGVLRGQKSRFQLFGDTVNTASRMETKGQAGRIHASESTATELIGAGKESWLTAREDKIVAKGKGEMQTYWIDPSIDSKDRSKASTATSQEDVSSEDNVSSRAVSLNAAAAHPLP